MLHLHYAAANVVKPHLCRWFGSMPNTLTLHQAASCNGGLYLSHELSSITETALFLGVDAKYRNLLMVRYDKIHRIIVTFKKLIPHLTVDFIKCRVSVYLAMFQTSKILNGRDWKTFSSTLRCISFKAEAGIDDDEVQTSVIFLHQMKENCYKSTPSDCSSTSL